MGETIGVVFVFMILVVLGFIFYGFVARTGAENKQQENVQLDAVKKVQVISSLPELQCSEDNDVTENCIDYYRLKAASGIITDNVAFYYDLFGFSKIMVKEYYPAAESVTLYNKEKIGFKDIKTTFVPIQLYDAVAKDYRFAVMEIGVYT